MPDLTEKTWCSSITALLIGLTVFSLLTGGQFSLLWSDGWIGNTDLAGAYASSLVFQTDVWRFPLGANPLFGATSVVFTDAVPIAALLAKCIAGFTGQPLSYLGGWFLLNSIATAFIGLLLGRELKLPFWGQAALAILLSANVIGPARMVGAQHLALSSVWLVLWGFLLVLRHSSARTWGLLLFLAAGIHAYLLATCLVLYLWDLVRNRAWIRPLATFPLLALWMYLLGYAYPTLSTVAVNEYKPYAADLAFFFNSFNWGVIPELFKPALPPQYDALLFLGSGGCLLIVAAVVIGVSRRTSWNALKELKPLLIPAAVLLTAATGLSLYIWGIPLVDIPLPTPLDKPFRTFRAIGRFGWSATFLLLTGSLLLVTRQRGRLGPVLVGLACLLQLADIANARHHSLIRPFGHLEQQPGLSELDRFLKQHADWNRQVYKLADSRELESFQLIDALLARQGARFNITHSARQSPDAVTRAGQKAKQALADGTPGLYVAGPSYASRLALPTTSPTLKINNIYFILNVP